MKTETQNKKNISQIAYLCLIRTLAFLGGFSFFGTRGAWFLALGFIVVLKQFFAKKISLSLPFAATVIFGTMLFVFRTIYSSFDFAYLVAYAVCPIVMFLLGVDCSVSRKELIAIAVSLALGHAAFAIGNVLYTLNTGDVIYPTYGLVVYYSFWTHNLEPRTFFSIDTTIVAALGAALLLHPGPIKKWYLRILGGLIICGYLSASVALGVRSPIVVAPLSLLGVAVYSILKEHSKKKRLIGLSVFAGVVLVFALFWVSVSNNLFGLRDFLMTIPGFNRFIGKGIGGDPRMDHYVVFFEHWLEYPWGGMYQARLLDNGEGDRMYFHNAFLQVYTHGGFPLTVAAIVLLVLLVRQIVLVKRTPENGACLTLSVSIIAAIFGIFMIEPMINSGPFISSYLFLAGGYLAGQLAKQRNEKPFFSLGLNDWEDSYPSPSKSLIRLALFILSGVAGGVLVFVTSGSPFYALFSLAAFVLVFLLLDKSQYNVVSWVKTVVSLAFATAIVVLEFRLLPNPSLLFSIAKVMIGFFSFLLVRVIIIQKRDPEDGYRVFRNLFIRISKEASLTEENLVN